MTSTATKEDLAAGRGYEALLVPALFSPWAPHVVDAAGIGDGASTLDIACGTGVLARQALKRSGAKGRVVGLDPAPGMIAAAAEVELAIEWVSGRAEDLPFEDNAFDHVISQFGMMFFEDRQKAADEMLRVLKPGGTLAVAVWHGIERNPAYRDVARLLEAEVGPAAAEAVRLPFSLGDPGAVADILSRAGFGDIETDTRVEQATFPDHRMIVEVELRGWLPLFGIHLDEDRIADVLAKADERLAKYAIPSGQAAFHTSACITTARKPQQDAAPLKRTH
ncbi:class I SAM-dependent methyltransferase [Oceanibium sediminis]|uniref:class I SAM-dependent methyltransferase n=1 Tax=Oceanibium sediminis TaxID=2026339 RepID=UPI0013001E8E|nr:methyltransferase domain-containing protein [Oceanibium sediminis]